MQKWTENHSLMASNCLLSSPYPAGKGKEGEVGRHPKKISASTATREAIGPMNVDQGEEGQGAEVTRMIGGGTRGRVLPDQGTIGREVGAIREIGREGVATIVEIGT